MYGIYVMGERPTSKKLIKVTAAECPSKVRLEATSIHGNEYDGMLDSAPDGTYTFVGPDPYTKRNFYGNIVIRNGKVKVT